jgi:hypothetical protein
MSGKHSLTFLLVLTGLLHASFAFSDTSNDEMDFLRQKANIVELPNSNLMAKKTKQVWITDEVSTGQAGIQKEEIANDNLVDLDKHTIKQETQFKKFRKRSRK